MVVWSGPQSGLEKKLKHLVNYAWKEQSCISCAEVKTFVTKGKRVSNRLNTPCPSLPLRPLLHPLQPTQLAGPPAYRCTQKRTFCRDETESIFVIKKGSVFLVFRPKLSLSHTGHRSISLLGFSLFKLALTHSEFQCCPPHPAHPPTPHIHWTTAPSSPPGDFRALLLSALEGPEISL